MQSPSLLRVNDTEAHAAATIQSAPVEKSHNSRDKHAGNYPSDTMPLLFDSATVPSMPEGTSIFTCNERAGNYPSDIIPWFVAPACSSYVSGDFPIHSYILSHVDPLKTGLVVQIICLICHPCCESYLDLMVQLCQYPSLNLAIL